jgi:hypothetical protein
MQPSIHVAAKDQAAPAPIQALPASAATRAPRQPRSVPDTSYEGQLNALAELDLAGLRRAWTKEMGREAPSGVGKDFLMRYLAYRLQAQAHGDIDRSTKSALEKIAHGNLSPLESSRLPGANLKPGAVLVREYKGETHQVTVLAEGYAWRGQNYTTLSAVARAITQTNWNGFVFFGLRQATSREAVNG